MALTFDSQAGVYRWQKGDCFKLSDHFTTDEFTCPCHNADCTDQKLHFDMIELLEDMRKAFAAPIYITSGFRCAKHQQELREGGAETTVGLSQHELGRASDVEVPNHTGAQIETVASKFFKAIGVAQIWCHLDLRTDKVRRWFYGR